MRQVSVAIGIFVLCTLSIQAAFGESAAPQRLTWKEQPLSVVLSVGEERMLHFTVPVSVGVPAGLDRLLRAQTVNGTIYLLANAAFPKTRILVREIDGGRVYLLDINAGEAGGHTAPITIVVDETMDAPAPSGREDTRYVGYVGLTRFASQQLYAPLRLLANERGIVRQPVRQEAIRLVPGDAVTATPLAAWRSGPLYVTAVRLTNKLKKARVLDPRTLRGQWLAATFQHARLLPAGDEADTTAVYLISSQPFESSF